MSSCLRLPSRVFQFTHPGRGATASSDLARVLSDVSIHAPREGCDIVNTRRIDSVIAFQFTHPGRGATSPSVICREFRRWFQFTHPGRGATDERPP